MTKQLTPLGHHLVPEFFRGALFLLYLNECQYMRQSVFEKYHL